MHGGERRVASRIAITMGHPARRSLTQAIADAYAQGAQAQGAEIRRMDLADMTFDPNLAEGYQARMELEPDLLRWREDVSWANRIAWIYPMWWGGMPAKFKGVLDRAFLPGFAMRFHDKGPWWDKLLVGRSADLIILSDTPDWWDRLVYDAPAVKQAKRFVLEYAGINPVRVTRFGPVKGAAKPQIEAWLAKARRAGEQAARS